MTQSEQITIAILTLSAIVFMVLMFFFSYKIGKEAQRLEKMYGENEC